MECIRLSSAASITPTESGALLRSDLRTFQLDGQDVRAFVTAMAPLLDGTHDREEVADMLGQYSRQSVLSFLSLLEQQGLMETIPDALADAEAERWRGQEEFFRKWMSQPEEAVQRLRAARVLVLGLEPWGVVAATELAAAGVGAIHLLDDEQIAPDDLLAVRLWNRSHQGKPRALQLREILAEESPWCVVTVGAPERADDGLLALDETRWDLVLGTLGEDELQMLLALARYAHRDGVPSLFGHLSGLDAVIGPSVVPGQTACWNCCRLRLLANAPHAEQAHALQASLLAERPAPRRHTYLAPMAATLGHLLALEAIKSLSRYTPSDLVGRIRVQNLVTLASSVHTVIRMPWCAVCGGASSRSDAPGGADAGGAYEEGGEVSEVPPQRPLNAMETPEELRERLAGLVDNRTGIIRYLMMAHPEAIDPELPLTCTAIMAGYTEGAYMPREMELGSGKGLTTLDAMISAAGEGIERYSAARYRKADLHRASYNALQEECLDPRLLCLYDTAQYEQPDFPYVPFDPDQPIDWVCGQWLDSGAPVWVPALLTYFNYHACGPEFLCQVSSNGLAAGTDYRDAAQRAVYELIERDAFMLSWLARKPGRRILPDNTLEAGIREVVRQLEERGAALELYHLDVGLHVPVIACIGFGDGKAWPGATISLACHLSPRAAVRKAILEQGHVGPYIHRLMREGTHPIPTQPEEVESLLDHALFYVPTDPLPAFDFLREGSEPIPVGALREPTDLSLEACMERIREAGVRFAAVDVTSPDIVGSPFRVARALGTNIQPIDFGFKRRRLGNPRLKTLLTSGVNPYPHPVA